jgi:hypothetical protein
MRKERKDYLNKLEYASFYAKSRAREIWSILYEREDEFNGYPYLEKNDLLVKLYLSPTEYETGFYDYLASKIVYGFQSILSALDKERK